ncbi:2-phosphosulfolactate phosphatase family protein [Clostridium sp. 19966]|uniref:2-phosphosulfolactate phosphatase family protein n=1 Tax=Clostridium sp. 19966 TaxID=2768166 RepID=UPI0028DF4980|nr:2-phosphosulfolactate phosphatase family protein [Clostridium sp. 19966]MDT8716738.1 2-phosphosulfolactate phosphatase family protein [Clostridium sp. 19966]
MNADIIISADDIKESKIRDKVVIVIDMLRATSVITTAFMNGCKNVIPVLTVERALEIAKDKKGCILGGERKAVKIEGFDCSNSPLEYTSDIIKNKELIMTTTNGTRAINECKAAHKILIGCLLNAKACSEAASKYDRDVVIVNAGTYGQFSMDDFICSGYIIECMTKQEKIKLTDIAFTAKHIYKQHEDILSFIKDANHFNVIKSLGLEEDLNYCIQKDITDVVPYLQGEIILSD